jgi:hypothetical protein
MAWRFIAASIRIIKAFACLNCMMSEVKLSFGGFNQVPSVFSEDLRACRVPFIQTVLPLLGFCVPFSNQRSVHALTLIFKPQLQTLKIKNSQESIKFGISCYFEISVCKNAEQFELSKQRTFPFHAMFNLKLQYRRLGDI